MDGSVITFDHVAKQFGNLVVHKDVSFSIYRGEVVTLLGPSGTGKTVILKLIIGLLRADAGEITVNGTRVNELNERDFGEIRKDIGMLFQGAALFDSLSVRENIAYSLREHGEKSEERISEIVKRQLDVVGLPGIENKFPPELSGGQKKRVGLARALANSPSVILFDEPTTGLDPTAKRLIDDLIIKLKRSYGITAVVVTHDIESARRISDRWILFSDGIVSAQGTVEEVSRDNQNVVDFISGNWRDL